MKSLFSSRRGMTFAQTIIVLVILSAIIAVFGRSFVYTHHENELRSTSRNIMQKDIKNMIIGRMNEEFRTTEMNGIEKEKVATTFNHWVPSVKDPWGGNYDVFYNIDTSTS